MYKHGNDYVEVTIHTMKSQAAAVAFLKYWRNERKATNVTQTKSSLSFTLTKPNVMTYCQVRKCLFTVSAFYTPGRAQRDVKVFTGAVEKKIISGK